MTARVVPDGPAGRAAAIAALRGGGIVALGTPGGIEALFAAKRRPPERGIVLLLDGPEQAPSIGLWPASADRLAQAFWPGGLTIVVPQRPDVTLPTVLTGGASTIGLRVPDHGAPRELARAVGPLPTTSANRSGDPEAPDASGILRQLGDAVALVLDGGPALGGPPSTVVDCSQDPPRVLRPGAISAEAIDAVLAGHEPRPTP